MQEFHIYMILILFFVFALMQKYIIWITLSFDFSFPLQEICSQVNRFLKGTSSPASNINFESLSSSALFLLRTVPVARHAVLEHYSLLFDDAINSSLSFQDRVPLGEQITYNLSSNI